MLIWVERKNYAATYDFLEDRVKEEPLMQNADRPAFGSMPIRLPTKNPPPDRGAAKSIE